MPPIHDTDIAAERWSQGEWDNYELWEKIEIRLRRRKYLWIAAAALVFLFVSAIPIVLDRSPKWSALRASRELAQVINQMKREAGMTRKAYVIHFQEGTLNYQVNRVSSCSQATDSVLAFQGTLLKPEQTAAYKILNDSESKQFKIPGLVDHFCYDPFHGSEFSADPNTLYAFGVAPAADISVKTMTEPRLDRISILFLRGPSAEISFE